MKVKQSRRLLSIVLTLSMVFTMLFMDCGMASAAGEGAGAGTETSVDSISITTKEPVVLLEDSGGESIREEGDDGVYYYHYNVRPEIMTEGTTLTVTTGTTVKNYEYTVIAGEGPCFKSGEDIISCNDIEISDDQSTNHWEAGFTYDVEAIYMGKTDTVSVIIERNPIKSIEVTVPNVTIELIEESGGSWAEAETETGTESYYYYNVWPEIMTEGTTLTVTYYDDTDTGTAREYAYTRINGRGCFKSKEGEVIPLEEIQIYDKQYTNHWTVNKKYFVEVKYMEKTTIVSVQILQNPIESIKVTVPNSPITLIKESGGYLEKDENGEDFYYYNVWPKIIKEGTTLTVTDKTGKDKEYAYTWIDGYECFKSGDGDEIPYEDIQIYDDQYTNHWGTNSTPEVEVEYMGRTAKVQVNVVESPIDSITMTVQETPIKLIKESGGRWAEDENGRYYDYNVWSKLMTEGTTLTVTTGTTSKDYTYDWNDGNECFKSADGSEISYDDIQISDDQRKNHWEIGPTYDVKVEYMGRTTTVPVEIVESPINSITVKVPKTPIEVKENSGGEFSIDYDGNEYYYYDAWSKIINEGMSLTVEDKAGNSIEYFYTLIDEGYCFKSKDGLLLPLTDEGEDPIRITTEQYSDHWLLGKTYIAEVEYKGKTAEVPIIIVENDIAAITYSPNPPFSVNKDEYLIGYDEAGKEYRYYDWSDRSFTGDKLIVTKTDGKKITYTAAEGDNHELYFVNSEGERIRGFDELRIEDDQYFTHWEVGNTYYITMEYSGKTTRVPVSFADDSQGGSSGGSNSYIPSTPADNVTNSGATGTDSATTTADINTTASNGTANAAVDKATADQIVDKAISNQSTEVVVEAKTGAGTAKDTTVTIPTDTVQKIADKTEAEFTVKTDAAEVTLDQKAVEAVASKAAGSDVEIVVEKTKDETKEMAFNLKVVSGGVTIGEFDGGNVKVTVKLNATLAAQKDTALICVYIDDNGTYSKVGGVKNNDGTYTFTTTHFSSYAIMAEEEADEIIEKQTVEDVKNVKLVARTAMSKAKGKKAVKLTWYAKDGSDVKLDGVEIYRSTKRSAGYGKKPYFTTTKAQYYNTAIKAGTKYYYKVRGYKVIDGKKYYTGYSTKAWRTVK